MAVKCHRKMKADSLTVDALNEGDGEYVMEMVAWGDLLQVQRRQDKNSPIDRDSRSNLTLKGELTWDEYRREDMYWLENGTEINTIYWREYRKKMNRGID